ncbi:type I restriction endonuclease subunit R, partial [Candidatus Parcubacteria bacterium]
MSQVHHEVNLEAHIVEQLTKQGWQEGEAAKYDRASALYPEDVIGWVKASQPEAWEKLERSHGADAGNVFIKRLVKKLQARDGGTLKALRDGINIAGAGRIMMSAEKPEDARNETALAQYQANRLRVVRQ